MAQRVKNRRESLGMTQDDLAQKLGYKSRSSINKIELGISDIPLSKIHEFANALHSDPLYLLLGERRTRRSDSGENLIRIAGRDGSWEEWRLTDEELKAVKEFILALPDAKDL
ncbi:MAG: helix-turn-helix domain-containing protein [Oscillospiraceae bacterium]|nr:helix-turn-helix domain-containing protein [Oscillospiraceae bacterium]